MLCHDTDHSLEAIHIPKEAIDLGVELYGIITSLKAISDGEAEISMKVQPGGHIPSFRCFFSKSRKQKKKTA